MALCQENVGESVSEMMKLRLEKYCDLKKKKKSILLK